jgi:hypothetical protein
LSGSGLPPTNPRFGSLAAPHPPSNQLFAGGTKRLSLDIWLRTEAMALAEASTTHSNMSNERRTIFDLF